MDPVDQRVKPVEVELGRNLQMYLQRLGLLPNKSPAFGLSAPLKVARSPTDNKSLNVCLERDDGRYRTAKGHSSIILSETNFVI